MVIPLDELPNETSVSRIEVRQYTATLPKGGGEARSLFQRPRRMLEGDMTTGQGSRLYNSEVHLKVAQTSTTSSVMHHRLVPVLQFCGTSATGLDESGGELGLLCDSP